MILDLNKLLATKQKEDSSSKDPTLDLKIFKCYLGIIGKFGDLLPSGQGIELFAKIMGKPLSETTVGFGGLIAALVALYNEWTKK